MQVEHLLKASGLIVNLDQHTVTADGERVALTFKEFELLRLFLSHPGIAFTRDQLMEEIWGTDYLGESRTVDMHIRTLRQKLGKYGDMIETVRNVGYRLEVITMTKKIFHSILLVAGAVLLASLFVITGALYEYFGIIQKKQLKDELGLAAVSVEQQGDDFLKRVSPDRYRITWINTQGNVIYDTRTDAESLENHADRTEIKQALKDGYGESIRYSSTLLEKTIYCAQRLTDGSVLRISVSRATIGVLMLGILQPILIVLIAALVLSGMLAKRLSKRIVEPLNSLDLEHRW